MPSTVISPTTGPEQIQEHAELIKEYEEQTGKK